MGVKAMWPRTAPSSLSPGACKKEGGIFIRLLFPRGMELVLFNDKDIDPQGENDDTSSVI